MIIMIIRRMRANHWYSILTETDHQYHNMWKNT